MNGFSFPHDCKIVDGYAPNVGGAAVVSGAYISLKNVQMAWVVIYYRQADGVSITWRVDKATAIAGTNVIPVTEVMNIWSNLACATSDLLVKRTAAINYASGTGAAAKLIIFQVDPASLGFLAADGVTQFDCIRGASTTAVAAAQYPSILYVLQPRYHNSVLTAPTVVAD
jgi:hypothetical protein